MTAQSLAEKEAGLNFLKSTEGRSYSPEKIETGELWQDSKYPVMFASTLQAPCDVCKYPVCKARFQVCLLPPG